jgi:tRNA(Ile)-lysidine synthase
LGKRAEKITMLTLETFKAYWDKQFPTLRLKRSHFLLATSGGVDSVVLAHLMHTIGAKCTIAHVNFQLRGSESTRDEYFVKQLGVQLGFPVMVQAFETAKYAEAYKMGIQEAAREIRYTWFESIIKELEQPAFLLTAHHADDQVETVLMQLFRGTGLHGLTGIAPLREDALSLARPLLNFTKAEIQSYALEHGLNFVEDSSNIKDDYTRNFIRHQIIPPINQVYTNASKNILSTVERLKEAELIIEQTVASFWKKASRKYKGIDCISITQWQMVTQYESYTWGLIKPLGFRAQQIVEVHKLLNANTGAYIVSDTHKLVKYKDLIQIVPLNTNLQHQLIYGEGVLQVTDFSLELQLIDRASMLEIPIDKKMACLDADKLDWPLLLRSWQSSDYFYPLGMNKKKKLNQFLGAAKLSPAEKEKTTVISSGDRIVWIVGQRIDHRFRITDATKHVLKITML